MSRIFDGSDLAGLKPWELPQVADSAALGDSKTDADRLTVRDVEAIQQRAYEDGFRLGHQEGLAAANAQIQRLNALVMRLEEPLADLDDQVVQELVAIVKALTRQLVRREMKSAPGGLVSVIREAVSTLPSAARNINVHLHPEDVKLVRELLSISQDNPTWTLTEDPVLTLGDCRVVTETSHIDATVERRLNALISAMLGGQRENDEEPGA